MVRIGSNSKSHVGPNSITAFVENILIQLEQNRLIHISGLGKVFEAGAMVATCRQPKQLHVATNKVFVENSNIVIKNRRKKSKEQSARVGFGRGRFHSDERQSEMGIIALTKMIQHDSQDVGAYFNRGKKYQRKGEIEKALADYTEVIRLDSDLGEAYFCRGNANAMLGQTANAIADFTEAIRLDPTNADAYYLRGLAYARQGQTASAIADFTEAIRLEPGRRVGISQAGGCVPRHG